MDQYQNLSHTKWDCKYHIVFIPKCRRKVLYGVVRQELGSVFRSLAEHKEAPVEEGHLMPDHGVRPPHRTPADRSKRLAGARVDV